MKKRVAYLFDASDAVGLGHYARVRAMRHWLCQVFGNDNSTFGWCDGIFYPNKIYDEDINFCNTSQLLAQVKSFSPDVIVIDSYDIAQLRVVANHIDTPVKLAFAEAFSIQWVSGFNILLDPTLMCVGMDRPERFITGVDAILLNKENYLYSSVINHCLRGVFYNCGNSEMAGQLLLSLRYKDFLGEGLEIKPGSSFGLFNVENHADVSIGDLNRHSSEVLVSAGQALWEATVNRDSFYIAALTASHCDLLERLQLHGVLTLSQVTATGASKFPIFHCAPSVHIRQRLREPSESVRKIARAILMD